MLNGKVCPLLSIGKNPQKCVGMDCAFARGKTLEDALCAVNVIAGEAITLSNLIDKLILVANGTDK